MNNLSSLCKEALSINSGIYLIETRMEKSYSYNDIQIQVEKVKAIIESVELVVIKLDNRAEFVIYFLASIIANRNILILNPAISNEETHERINELNLIHLIVDKDFIKLDHKVKDNEIKVLDPKVYIGTSATTGQSKLVPQSYQNIKANIRSISEHHKLENRKVIATALPLFHVNALYFSFLAGFISGGQLVLLDPLNILNHAIWCKQYDVSILSTIPILINQYLRNADKIFFEETRLQYLVSAAAPLSKNTLAAFIERYNIKILQGYGLSEAINFSCTLPIDIDEVSYKQAMFDLDFPSIGVPLIGNEIEILADENELVGPGEVGEILIKGENVFSGYHNDKNEDIFWKNYFKTGDLGFYKIINSKKFYYISGRKKEVAKINSNSVSLRWIDDQWNQVVKIKNDFIATSFTNQISGELLAVIIAVKQEDIDNVAFLDYILAEFDLIKTQYRPSVLLMVEESIPIRTASGKALRWSFRDQFKKYEIYQKVNSFQVSKLYKKDLFIK